VEGSAFTLFNPNDWVGESRGVVQSCATELAVLEYTTARIETLCATARELCSRHFETLNSQWQTSPWNLSRVIYFGQVPELHVLIEGFFAGLKSLLDLDSQLLTTEGVVGVAVDGFHRAKGVYGGSVINALENNVRKGKEAVAAAVKDLAMKHKALWIDAAIASRDVLVHPLRGAQQLMFEIRIETSNGSLVYLDAVPPHVGETPIAQYTAERVEHVRQFSVELLEELRNAA
jgi:hypothetical protein